MDGMGAGSEFGLSAYALINQNYGDDFFSLPEEVQEQVNAHASEFHSQEDMRKFIRDLMRRA